MEGSAAPRVNLTTKKKRVTAYILFEVSWQWKTGLWHCRPWCRVVQYVVTNISKEPAASWTLSCNVSIWLYKQRHPFIHVSFILYLKAVTILDYTIKLWYEQRLLRHIECGRKRHCPEIQSRYFSGVTEEIYEELYSEHSTSRPKLEPGNFQTEFRSVNVWTIHHSPENHKYITTMTDYWGTDSERTGQASSWSCSIHVKAIQQYRIHFSPFPTYFLFSARTSLARILNY
jgi:hypothetical protein